MRRIGLCVLLAVAVASTAGCVTRRPPGDNSVWQAEQLSRKAYRQYKSRRIDQALEASTRAAWTMGARYDGSHQAWVQEVDDSWRPPTKVWVKRDFDSHVWQRHAAILCEAVVRRAEQSAGDRAALQRCWNDLGELERAIMRLSLEDTPQLCRRVAGLREDVGLQLLELECERVALLVEAGFYDAAIDSLDRRCVMLMEPLDEEVRSLLRPMITALRDEAEEGRALQRARADMHGVADDILQSPPIDSRQLGRIERSIDAVIEEMNRIRDRLMVLLDEMQEALDEELP